MFDADRTIFLRDFGSPARWTPSNGAVPASGLMLFDRPTESIDGGDVLSTQYRVTLAVADWPGLRRGERLVIDGDGGGHTYRLRTDLQYVGDGAFAEAPLTRE